MPQAMPWKSGRTSFIHFPLHFLQLPQFSSQFVASMTWVGHSWLWRKGFPPGCTQHRVLSHWHWVFGEFLRYPRASTAAWGPSRWETGASSPPSGAFLSFGVILLPPPEKFKPEFFNPKFPSLHTEGRTRNGSEFRNFRKLWK